LSLSSRLRHELHGQERLWLLLAAGFVLIFHAVQLALLVVRFGHLPNYVTVFDWPHNIATIIRSTQSAQDMVSIILEPRPYHRGFERLTAAAAQSRDRDRRSFRIS
jgi:hypothetical protein